MNIDMVHQHSVEPARLAAALAKASPQDFALFWFAFAEEVDQADESPLMAFAHAMTPRLGAKRQSPLRELVRLMDYHLVNEQVRQKGGAA